MNTFLQDNAWLLMIMAIMGIIGCLLLMVFGINMWQNERKSKDPSADSPEGGPTAIGAGAPASKPAQPLSGFLAGLTRPREPQNSGGSAYEVLRVMRDRLTGRVVIEVGGKRYGQLNEIDDLSVQQGLAVTLRDLQEFAGASATPAPPAPVVAASPPAVPTQTVSALPTEPGVANGHSQPAVTRSETSAPTPQAPAVSPIASAPSARASTPSAPPPLRVPSMNPFKQMQVLREINANQPAPLKTIPEQIDDILQVLVVGTSMMSRGLHVRTGPRGNVVFELDGQAVNAVDDISDPQAQAFVRDAIKRWEQSQ
jgi:hypothetical protein